MKPVLYFFLLGLGLVSACENPGVLVENNTAIEHFTWTYVKPIRVSIPVERTNAPYNVILNLRHTEKYKYSNIFLRIKQIGPDKKVKTWRKEYRLANLDGEWLGTGSGNLRSHQLVVFKNYRFPLKGTYIFEVEQNMRDNPLKEITDVGLRVEQVQ